MVGHNAVAEPSGIQLPGRKIGRGQPCFIIAEAGVNHNGREELAFQLVDIAAAAGADAIKFQTFRAESLATRSARMARYQIENIGIEESQHDMLRKLELSRAAHQRLIEYSAQKGILFLSSPFDEGSADFLVKIGVPLLKIPSGEVTNIGFLEHLGALGPPLILSTGMSDLEEVAGAVKALRSGAVVPDLVLLHCVSNYPARDEDCNLLAMHTLEKAFGLPVGFSDHTVGTEVAMAAVALGAVVIEKHFTIDPALPGPDHKASLSPKELASLVRGIRRIELAIGDGRKRRMPAEEDTAQVARRSLVFADNFRAQTVIKSEMLIAKRPATGVQPGLKQQLVGRRLRCDVELDQPFAWEMLD